MATETGSKSEYRFILSATGASQRGQVAALSGFVDSQGGFVESFQQYDDPRTRRFFARAVFRLEQPPPSQAELLACCRQATRNLQLQVSLQGQDQRPRVLIMVSKPDHCLRDLLYRHARGELAMEISAIVSNHRHLQSLAEQYQLHFVHLPVNDATRSSQEAQLLSLIEATGSELVVLARYMQILSDDLVEHLHGRTINIHHSFLPGFKGAQPYRQAYERGVKLIGATAHFVTPDLDEGPIIEQVVQRVDHTATPQSLAANGRDCECRALAAAVRYYLERRVFLNGGRTVVL